MHLENAGEIQELETWTHKQLSIADSLLHDRATNGFLRSCHGDLHLDNVIFWNERFQFFDGIEFNEELSDIDVANDLAFLLMELAEHGYREHANRLLSTYLEQTRDYTSLEELRFYLVYRAMVRAKVDLIRQVQESGSDHAQLSDSGKRYLEFAHKTINVAKPTLYLMRGLSGSGKSTVAMKLVERLGAIRLRSDWIRKSLLGKSNPLEKTDSNELQQTYSHEATVATYDEMLRNAENVLRAGFSAIADATFLTREQRMPFEQLAQRMGVTYRIVACTAPDAELIRRLENRSADPSDATAETLVHQHQVMDSFTADERQNVVPAGKIVVDEVTSPKT
ncbi:MAG: AAA family ATPase [Pirellulaceae bacterium]